MIAATMRTLSLGELLDSSGIPVQVNDHARGVRVSGIADDSRLVRDGDVYLALRGALEDGRRFIPDAISRGAAVVLAESDDQLEMDSLIGNVPVIAVRGLRAQAGILASVFFGDASHALRVIAVTGTNGKTTTSWLIANALARLGRRAAVLGTLGVGAPGTCRALRNTTPGAVELQRLLAELREDGFQDVVMEASSIGIEQQRMAGTRIQVAVFTNLTRDHLDYHVSMDAYAQAKAILFSWPGLAGAVINADDPCALRWLAEGRVRAARIMTYGNVSHGHDIELAGIEATPAGTRLQMLAAGEPVSVDTRLLGQFNASNLMAVTGTLMTLGYPLRDIAAVLGELTPPAGRMQSFGGSDGMPLCVVDYAHSPAALESVLNTLRERTAGSLWCVFGCGGDRDRGKRPQMGEVAARLADQVVLTSDNPRSEDPLAIIGEIRGGIPASAQVHVEADREKAIGFAVNRAARGDTVLVAGKGHEDYQESSGVRTPFSDADVVRQALIARAGGDACR